ncbi:TolC family protein [Poritiphilus flavus]|uniref:TolC family protein n=1 Tax=Poritiphilus flavus TaxID=2697053 RepID=UPI001EEA87CC|nr:TolC family protein [Poritiphilus flavus]
MKQLLYILIFLICSASFAQQKWTLDDCVAYALKHNLQLNDFEYSQESGKETYRQSIRNLLPSVSGNADYSIRFGRSVDPNDNSIVNTDFFSNNYSIEGSVGLFQGFQRINSLKASKFIYNATKQETLQQKYLLAFRVMAAFYDIQFFEGLLEISREQLQVSQTNYELVEKQISLGLMAGADLYEAESALLTDKLNVTQSENQLAAAKLVLIQEMNLEGETDISVIADLKSKSQAIDTLEVESDIIFDKAMEFIPIIKAQELRTKAAKKSVAAARGTYYPSLTLFGGYGTGYFETITDTLGTTIPFRDQFRDNTFQFVGVSLSVPLYTRGATRSQVKQQKIALMREQNNLEIQEQVLYQTIQQLVQEYNALEAETAQSEKQAKSQELAFQIAQKRYEKGLINAIELITAKNLFATAQNQNLQARLRLEVNKSTLEFYSGIQVFNIN